MGDRVDFRPSTAQPPPVHVDGADSVHDLVCAELGAASRHANLFPPHQNPQQGRRERMLIRLIRERRAVGKQTYGTVLQIDNGRDPTKDGLEEIADALLYFFQARARGVPGAAGVYEALKTIALHATERWYWPNTVGHPGAPEHGLLYRHYLDAVAEYRVYHQKEREGQAHFNVLRQWDNVLASEVAGTDVDPFDDDNRLPAFLTHVARRMGEETADAA